MRREFTKNRAGGFAAPSQPRPLPPATAHPVAPAAQPALSLIEEARAEAVFTYLWSLRLTVRDHIEISRTGQRPYEFYNSERSRLKWLMRLPDDYEFETNCYRWALSAARRATLPPPVVAPDPPFTGPWGSDNPNRIARSERNIRRMAAAIAQRQEQQT